MIQKVLLIEDDESLSFLYKRQLELAGMPTDAVITAKQGLEASLKDNYDVILLDILLPDMNGLDILKALKKNELSKNTPVIMLTNLGQDSVIKEGFSLGAIGYLIKSSFTPDQVVQELKNILKQQENISNPISS